jgi:NitT/TauT family transport system ATP-binding protein
MKALLEVDSVSFAYHTKKEETQALNQVSFTIYEGEFVSIVGPSGCGKSTLLSLIAGLMQPEEGRILFKGRPVEENRQSIGYMLQKDQLFPWRNVMQNVLLGLEIQKKKTKEQVKRISAMLDTYGLGDFKEAKPSQLSGGMRQRAALVRTLALEPELLLLDEPFSALDYQTRLNVADDIGNIIRKEKKTALLVTHDLSEAISMGDRVLVLGRAPAVIKKEIRIEFPGLSERTAAAARGAYEFKDYFNLLWKEMNEA